jgi:protein Mpv17
MTWATLPGRTPVLRRALQRTSQAKFKRTHSTKSPSSEHQSPSWTTHGSKPSETSAPRAIPGPIWLWTEPLDSYTRAHSRRPYLTQFISALIIYLIGDLTSQRIAPSSPDDTNEAVQYDPRRTARALAIGGIAAIPGYNWFLFLARHFNYRSKAFSIGVKVVVNQMVFTPIFNCYFFGMHSGLSGATAEEIVERIQHTVPKSWVNSWKLWPAVTAFSFAFIRVELRGLFAGSLLTFCPGSFH